MVNYWLIQAPIHAVYQKHKAPDPIPSDPPPEKAAGEELEPYEIPLPPRPVHDPGESAAEKTVRLKAFANASLYYLIFTLISFVSLCGGPGMHFFLGCFCECANSLAWSLLLTACVDRCRLFPPSVWRNGHNCCHQSWTQAG